ncbi:mechanosensitive ion channel domain-containing protein [Chitinophaga pollutisoli]|uniref:Mechanosensitive ion channel domain-containing protein n=1 Tax=Chitinophaga pollutisoli TaxID=3133966 RepID=A0ABZ2YL09_9BACT
MQVRTGYPFRFWLPAIFCCLLSVAGYGQHADSLPVHRKDSLLQTIRAMLQKAPAEYAAKYKEHGIANEQDGLMDELLRTIRHTRGFLKTPLDTNAIYHELASVRQRYIIAGDGIFTNTGSLQTERNLTTSYKLIHELLGRVQVYKLQVDAYKKRLVGFRKDFDSIASNPRLYATPADSAEFMHLVRKLYVVGREVDPIDSALSASLRNAQHAKDQLDIMVYDLQSALEQIERYEKELSRQTFDREVGSLGLPPENARPFREILWQSVEKNRLILWFYVRNNLVKIAILLILTAFCIIFLRTLRGKVKVSGLLRDDFNGQLVLRFPVLSAMLIVFSIFQFIFPDPPWVFNCLLWVISSACLTVIFYEFITPYWMRFWWMMWILFLLACGDFLLLQASRPERWFMLALAFGGMLVGGWYLARGRRDELREKWIIYFMYCIVGVELLSAVANLTGRFNLAKALMASGFISVIIAIMFLWTVRLINEALQLASKIYQVPERRMFFVNFAAVGQQAPRFFYFFLIIGWFILFARTFYAFKLITEPVKDFLMSDRTIGSYTFSFFSVLAFFIILILSSIISRIVSFFASDKSGHPAESGGQAGLGSWLLVVRIFIFVLGLLLAFAVAGIPLDRATFVMGALGVGIGFGLQTLVNNLVSGVILAFEKPLNVGDFVEVKGKSGTVKSIGFRSSMLQTLEGGHLVIPNGELLNDELINWNIQTSIRRNELTVGVSYDADLEKVEGVLQSLLKENSHILKTPEPVIWASEFGDSAVLIQVYFWTVGLRPGKVAKSALIFAIHKAFKEQGIVIPFPQRDLHIKRGDAPDEEKRGQVGNDSSD